jgi:hypothetical protein
LFPPYLPRSPNGTVSSLQSALRLSYDPNTWPSRDYSMQFICTTENTHLSFLLISSLRLRFENVRLATHLKNFSSFGIRYYSYWPSIRENFFRRPYLPILLQLTSKNI